jgi:hypothetical protein
MRTTDEHQEPQRSGRRQTAAFINHTSNEPLQDRIKDLLTGYLKGLGLKEAEEPIHGLSSAYPNAY